MNRFILFQGRVYGAHFAWSHLWWAVSYPIAGWLGSHASDRSFFYSSLIGFMILTGVQIFLAPKTHKHEHEYLYHEHEHEQDEHHQHEHLEGMSINEPHTHAHEHLPMSHSHSHYADTHHLHSH